MFVTSSSRQNHRTDRADIQLILESIVESNMGIFLAETSKWVFRNADTYYEIFVRREVSSSSFVKTFCLFLAK